MSKINIINTDQLNIEYKIKIFYHGAKDDRTYHSFYDTKWNMLKSNVPGFTYHVPGIIKVPEVHVYLKHDNKITKLLFRNISNTNTIHFTFHKGTDYPYVRINNQPNDHFVTVSDCGTWIFTILCFPFGGCCVCGDPETCADCFSPTKFV